MYVVTKLEHDFILDSSYRFWGSSDPVAERRMLHQNADMPHPHSYTAVQNQ